MLLVTVNVGGSATIEPVDALFERSGLEGFPEAVDKC
jgi:hypothetical protein